QRFPRFSIGESLLAHCLDFIEEAGMLEAIESAGFQVKHGAAFACGERSADIDFRDGYTVGKGSTFQVERSRFDKILADEAQRQGVEIRYEEEVVAADFSGATPQLRVKRLTDAQQYLIDCEFVLDASGYGRVLPRLLGLEQPSNFPVRKALFTHIEDHIDSPAFNRERILISTHPELRDVWYWTIPFSNGRTSVGVVADASRYASLGDNPEASLRELIRQAPSLNAILANAVWDTPVSTLGGYSANVKRMHGQGFALLGNAAEFLDPVFSSGVTIAMRS
ncbi:MAG TPA: FAD-dependent oxidoreductase, partial [Pseudomonas sp.]|nr:FAD-dependent oxidoreductase [Pseudomonas sp.]